MESVCEALQGDLRIALISSQGYLQILQIVLEVSIDPETISAHIAESGTLAQATLKLHTCDPVILREET